MGELLAAAPPTSVLLVVGAAVLVGAFVQGLSGFGMAVVAAPITALVDPTLLPATLLVLVLALPALTAVRERRHIAWREVGVAMIGRLPGTVVGLVAVAVLPPRGLALVVAVAVLAAVGASSTSWRPVRTTRTLLLAGSVSGALATATSIGGPPMALLYQRSSGATARATMGAFFAFGVPISLGLLAATGQVSAHQVSAGLVLLPVMAVGFLVSSPVRRHVDAGGRFRLLVLTVTAVSGLLLLVRTVLG